jgi:F-type H+-transporting ATPase subunit gamma
VASAELRDIRRRIKSVEATAKITRAMELIAASRIPKASARVNASKPYSTKMVEVISKVSTSAGSVGHPLLEERDVKTVGVLVVASDRGLCGAYATSVIRLAERQVEVHRAAGRRIKIYAVGKKAQAYFSYRKFDVEQAFLGVTDRPGYGDARAVSNKLMDHYASGRIDRVDAFYTQYLSSAVQELAEYQLLPVSAPEAAEGEESASVSYEFEPSAEEILNRLLPRYVEATIFSMLLEASASEHSARRRAMKAATDNADDLTKNLSRTANRARQAEITTEISEIVGGAEALNQ